MAQGPVVAGYKIELERPSDSQIKSRDKGARILSALLTAVAIVAGPTFLIGYWGKLLDHETIGSLLGFIVGAILLARIASRRLFVYNPEWRGYVTQDVGTGRMVSYGPGLHPSHWWEQRNASGNYSLEVKSQPFGVAVATLTSKVLVSGVYEYVRDLPLLERSIGISPSVVEKGIVAFIENYLTDTCDDKKAEHVLKEIEPLNKGLSDRFMSAGDPVRNKYGFRTTSVVINKIELPPDVQKTRDSLEEAGILFEIVAKLHGRTVEQLTQLINAGTITDAQYQKMLTRAMAVSDNKTTIDVKIIEGLEGKDVPAATAGAVMGAFQNGGKK